MNYKMIIQFDGGRYRGFQKQTGTKENESTIQGKLESEGNGFLQNMARIIAGTILEAGTGKRDTESVRKIFSGGAREDAGAMLPSQGLKLLNVKY